MARYIKSQKRKTNKKKTRMSSKKVSASFAKKVRTVLHKQSETKVAIFQSNVTAFNQQANSSGDCLRLIPTIAQGTGQGQRVGASVRLQSLHIRGVLTFTLGQTSASLVRIGVRMMILRAKRFSDWQQTQTDFASSYTRLLEGNLTGLNGDLSNWNTPPNRDYFSVVKDKRFVMTLGQGATTNETFNSVRHYKFKIPYSNRNLIYDENYDVDDPVNYPYVMILSYTKLDGALPDLAATTYLTNQYVTTAKYEDI